LRPLRQELQLHGHCEEIPLEFLSVPAVGQYLTRRFPGHRLPAELAVILHRHTDGNPLFVVNTVDYLIAQGQVEHVDDSGPSPGHSTRSPWGRRRHWPSSSSGSSIG
jgi:hypothetical protein